VAEVDATRIPHRFNFLLSLPQDRTERILIDVLREAGVAVEQSTAFSGIALEPDGARVRLTTKDGEKEERFAWVIGADGAHSAVRKALGIGFPGSPYPFEWSLADVDIDGPVEGDRGEIRLGAGRPVLIRLPIGPGRHRLIANGPDVLGGVPRDWRVTAEHWRSSFKVSHRQAESLGEGRVWIAGDAAHIHSPAGGRGMNLGIEDAATLAEAIASGGLGSWPERRRAKAAEVIRLSDALQGMATRDTWFGRRVLPRLLGLALRIPAVHAQALARMASL
jgi:2-polyprenyl-6-methoxyphenol hydroxylase-like FAD-dependent oxidoreductase